jgi:preprotein translocase subunit SecF
MALVRYFPIEPKLNFMGQRRWFFAISMVLLFGSLALFLTRGLNYGVDFTGGIVMEVQTEGPADLDGLRGRLNGIGLGEVQLQSFGSPDVVLINLPRQDGGEEAQQQAIEKVEAALGSDAKEYRRVEAVGPKVGDELRTGALVATILAMAGIAIYVWVRYDLNFAIAALASLLHDVAAVIGFLAITGYEFNLTTMAAVLTVAGYSINDTVVIYDRVREELRRYKKAPIDEVLNRAINATLSRTTLTSLTTVMALLSIFLFGGDVLEGFSAGIIVGIVVGTYSSWGVAVPLLSLTRLRPRLAAAEPETKPGKAG